MTSELTLRAGLRDTLPTVFGYVGIGLAFGIVARAQGFNIWLVILMSAISYGGSGQFIMVSMLASFSPILSIMLAAFLVNARMILMSTVIAPYMKKDTMLQNILIGTLITDESFALAMNKINLTDRRLSFAWFTGANVEAYLAWAIASGVGAWLGNLVPNANALGLDFALVAMFIGLLYLQVISDRSISRPVQGIVILAELILVYVGMIVIPSNALLLVATLLGCLIGVVITRGH